MPVRKTRKQRKTRRLSSRRSLSSRHYQRGGADGCGRRGQIRLPEPYGCIYYYAPEMPAALSSVDPYYKHHLKHRVTAAFLEYRVKRLKEGATEAQIIMEMYAQIEKPGWPEDIRKNIFLMLEYLEADNIEAFVAFAEPYMTRYYRKSIPPYAPLSSPPSTPPSPVRSEEPIVRALNYSESADKLQTPPASADTKEELLKWISKANYADTHDPISGDAWSDMSKEKLQQTVRTQEGRVYTAASLEGIFRTAMEADAQARNAVSRNPLTRKNARALRNVMRQTNPAYELPSRTQQRPPKHMGFSVAETADGAFYQLSLIDSRNGTELGDLGFIPANIDESVSGSTDATSAVAIAMLQRAWDSGKFLSSYRRPFECCRFHLGKTREYWSSPGGTPAGRLAAMIEEIKSIF